MILKPNFCLKIISSIDKKVFLINSDFPAKQFSLCNSVTFSFSFEVVVVIKSVFS